MAAIVSTRIIRLQAVSPRLAAANLQSNVNVPATAYIAGTLASSVVSDASTGGAAGIAVADPSLQAWTTSVVFSSASDTQVNWTAGTLATTHAGSYVISAGNTGAMAALTYIYLDIGVSLTVLQKTTTYSSAVGNGKILIAAAQNGTGGASVIPYGGQQPLVNGAQITARSITAGAIATGTLTANEIGVTSLSAIQANLGSVYVSTSGEIRSGATSYGSGTGWWMDYNGGSPRFRVGTVNGTDVTNGISWNGTRFRMDGDAIFILQHPIAPAGGESCFYVSLGDTSHQAETGSAGQFVVHNPAATALVGTNYTHANGSGIGVQGRSYSHTGHGLDGLGLNGSHGLYTTASGGGYAAYIDGTLKLTNVTTADQAICVFGPAIVTSVAVSAKQPSDGSDTLAMQRYTDAGTPAGYFLRGTNAAGNQNLFTVSTLGELIAAGNVYAYSDDRLKDRIGNIDSALDKVRRLNGFLYRRSELAQSKGLLAHDEDAVGISAQELREVLPGAVAEHDGYLTIDYGRVVPLLLEAIKELDARRAP